jgi:hypothetical protein
LSGDDGGLQCLAEDLRRLERAQNRTTVDTCNLGPSEQPSQFSRLLFSGMIQWNRLISHDPA